MGETNTRVPEGVTGGFHYGDSFNPCNGVLHATDKTHPDGRQIYVCDACGSECVRRHEGSREDGK
jgi:hypothetical protein